MTKKTTLLTLLATTIFFTSSLAQRTKEYLDVPGPIVFEKNAYQLDWSSHPVANFYKQEYLVKGDTAGKYKTMVLMDVMVTGKGIKEIAGEKIAELKKLKETNPVVNYEIFDNPSSGEYMLDFVLSANTADGKYISIVERNVYRYKAFTDKNGKKGVLLFGISTRGYGNSINSFFASLKANRKALIDQVAKFTIPDIAVAK
jgi:hypothetical protein